MISYISVTNHIDFLYYNPEADVGFYSTHLIDIGTTGVMETMKKIIPMMTLMSGASVEDSMKYFRYFIKLTITSNPLKEEDAVVDVIQDVIKACTNYATETNELIEFVIACDFDLIIHWLFENGLYRDQIIFKYHSMAVLKERLKYIDHPILDTMAKIYFTVHPESSCFWRHNRDPIDFATTLFATVLNKMEFISKNMYYLIPWDKYIETVVKRLGWLRDDNAYEITEIMRHAGKSNFTNIKYREFPMLTALVELALEMEHMYYGRILPKTWFYLYENFDHPEWKKYLTQWAYQILCLLCTICAALLQHKFVNNDPLTDPKEIAQLKHVVYKIMFTDKTMENAIKAYDNHPCLEKFKAMKNCMTKILNIDDATKIPDAHATWYHTGLDDLEQKPPELRANYLSCLKCDPCLPDYNNPNHIN